MPSVIFWWKPGCATNTRQITLLVEAGCTVDTRDLLAGPWTAAVLAQFMGARPVAEWFNPAAPAVKDGSVVPASFSAEAALARLVAEPLLIRRPLLQIGEARCCGFDGQWLAAQGVALGAQPVPEGCSHAVAETDGVRRNPAAYCAPPSGASLP